MESEKSELLQMCDTEAVSSALHIVIDILYELWRLRSDFPHLSCGYQHFTSSEILDAFVNRGGDGTSSSMSVSYERRTLAALFAPVSPSTVHHRKNVYRTAPPVRCFSSLSNRKMWT